MKSIGEFLIDCTFHAYYLLDSMMRRKKPGELLQHILSGNINGIKESIHSLKAEDLNHPWYAKKLIKMLYEDPIIYNAASEKEKEIVKKVRR